MQSLSGQERPPGCDPSGVRAGKPKGSEASGHPVRQRRRQSENESSPSPSPGSCHYGTPLSHFGKPQTTAKTSAEVVARPESDRPREKASNGPCAPRANARALRRPSREAPALQART